ncbi:hypothetical protein EXIGLDRAFT_731726 [Exidia glandulosa HHB12029]|uniref:F-box domain-containing protein n=1 Tax=Exidia glandulosa HHB12029 TaxID=1314781 RepID=A0A165BRN5_EXIGL|nr:hypothetical protein EXIGLDRAFT_731726 [Exidia glandulosa HHB12029]
MVQPDALRAMWLSMTNLVALALKGRSIPSVSDWGLKNVYFPKLRRMRMDSKSLCPSLITLHFRSLTHLRFDDDVVLPPGCMQATSLTHYIGPLEAVLRFGAHATALQVCAIYEREEYRRTEWPSLSPLAAHRSLRTLMVVVEASEIELLRMLKDCHFPSVDELFLLYNNVWSNPVGVVPFPCPLPL